MYKTQDDEFLAGTGEVATKSYYEGEILEKSEIPKKFLAFSLRVSAAKPERTAKT